MSEINYSKYQLEVFDFIKYGYGNAVVQAVPGSGKSFTIVKSLEHIKEGKHVLFLAFNESIVQELSKKINRSKTDVKTLHSLGFSMLKSNYKDLKIAVDENKYLKIINNFFNENGFSNDIDLKKQKKYVSNIVKLCNLSRLYLATDKKGLTNISIKYGLTIISDEIDITFQILYLSKELFLQNGLVDFTDMLYLPNVLLLKPYKYDFIIIDEAQDLSIAQMKLFLKCLKQGGRFLAVGDEKQCINSFAGSSIDSFNKLRKTPNTIELPLSISYRCPKKVIEFVKHLNPDIECKENAIDGEIIYKSSVDNIKDGDMVVCRNTAPLIKLYLTLISQNKKAFIKGKDVGLSITELIENIYFEDLNQDLESECVFSELYKNAFKYSDYCKDNLGLTEEEFFETQIFLNLIDKLEVIEFLSQNLKTKTELIEKINNIFSDENKQGICLSTVHKAKGLEADNVFILNKHLMNGKYAKLEWEKEQERNIEYVAYTRPKQSLHFLYDENSNEKNQSDVIQKLKKIYLY